MFRSLIVRNGIMRRLVAAAAALVMTGCLDAGPDATEPISIVEEGLFKTDAFGWPRDPDGVTTTVPVCWDPSSYVNGPPEPARTALKDFVRRAVEETWQRESGLVFTGWGDCPGSIYGIILQMTTSARGKTNALPSLFVPQHADVQLPVGGGISGFLRYTTIHEFGHAIGLNHEQARPDNNGRCTIADDLDWLVQYVPGPLLTPYDARSVMNYCAPNPTELSPLDILGVQRVYGRKPGTNLVTPRGSCVGTSGTAVVLTSCRPGTIPWAFSPWGDAIRMSFFTGSGTATGAAIAPASTGLGLLTMTTGPINPNWDRYGLVNVTIRGLGGMKLNVAFGRTTPNAAVQTWEDGTLGWASHDQPAELWTFMSDLTIRGIGGQCLTVKTPVSATGNPVVMIPCDGSQAQQWKLLPDGRLNSAVGPTSQCLEVARDETDVVTPFPQAQDAQTSQCNTSLRQKWTVRGPVTTLDQFGCISAPGLVTSNVAQAVCSGAPEQIIDVHW